MNAEIISVGTELLLGEILNTDARFLAIELSELGIDVYYQTVVGDNKQRLTDTVKTALKRSDIVIATGGLGPTPDDLTKEVIAELMKKELVMDKRSLERMEEYLKAKGLNKVKCNQKQALIPKDSIVLDNNCGTAPGCIIEDNSKIVIMLPGPPHEMEKMYLESVKPYLMTRTNQILYSENLGLYGIGESKVSEILDDYIKNSKNPTVAPYAQSPGVRLRLTAKCANKSEGIELIRPIKKDIYNKLSDFIYTDQNETLNETVIKMLIEKNMTISVAESCTGGLFAKMITDVSGSSQIFNESYITYANDAKTKILGVKEETLKKYGAVSPDTAYEMAEGLYGVTKSDVCICFTGIAGPLGGTQKKPVGLVFVGIRFNNKTEVIKLNLGGTRDKIRNTACLEGLNIIRKKMLDFNKST